MRRGGGSRRERGREGSGGGRRERQASRDGTLGLSGPGAGLRGSADPHAAPAGTSSCFLGSSWVRLGRWGCQHTTSQPGTSWQSRALGPQPTWATGHFCAEGVYGPTSRRSHARPCPGQCQPLLLPCTQSPLLSVCSMETQRAPPPPAPASASPAQSGPCLLQGQSCSSALQSICELDATSLMHPEPQGPW